MFKEHNGLCQSTVDRLSLTLEFQRMYVCSIYWKSAGWIRYTFIKVYSTEWASSNLQKYPKLDLSFAFNGFYA